MIRERGEVLETKDKEIKVSGMIRERGEVLETKDKEIKVSLMIWEREGRSLKLRTRKSR